ncbi:MAG: NAD(+)/NADH kinase, partial [Synergistaceae bacterium]|nr:NAD(+)/NADH kinase [Synergistaceae bacterium]
MKDLGLIINLRKAEAVDTARKLLAWGQAHDCKFLLPHQEASALMTAGLSDEEWLKTVKIALVIGGDGTFLRAARYVLDSNIILHGVNLGHLGFLASSRPQEIEQDLEYIINEEFEILNRKLLKCVIYHQGQPSHKLYALK